MDAKRAMEIGMEIAESHSAACLELLNVKPDATHKEMLLGAQVWLGTKIMRAICEAADAAKKS